MTAIPPTIPPTLAANPRLDRWIRVDPEGTLTIRTGKVEIGQGAVTAIAAIAARELGVRMDQLRVVSGDTTQAPDEGTTAGSMSMEYGGAAMRRAAAHVRTLFAQAAAAELDAAAEALEVQDGVFGQSERNARRSYWDLRGKVDLARSVTDLPVPAERGGSPDAADLARLDLPAKLTGAAFIHDLRLPGMLHGRVVRPRHPQARLAAVDMDALRALQGVTEVVVDGSFVGLVAAREDEARHAAAAATAHLAWTEPAPLPADDEWHGWMDALPANTAVLIDRPGDGRAVVQRHQATFARPSIAHASIGPCCAVASWQDGRVTVWSHTQGVYPLRAQLARALRVPPDAVDVIHRPGSGCYGHNGADDVALDAALLARGAGAPVMCQWSRADELCCGPVGAAMRVHLTGGLDAEGRIAEWSHEIFSPPHVSRPTSPDGSSLLAAWSLSEPLPPPVPTHAGLPAGTGERNAVPPYRTGAQRIVHHLLPQGPLRSSALRSLGAHCNVFAVESFMDELAALAGADALRFRLDHLDDPRARRVLIAAAELAGWDPATPGGEGVGRGIGFARYKSVGSYCAVVAEVAATDRPRLRRACVAVDCGLVVHRDGLLNQIEGAVVQATSWTLHEAAGWDGGGPTSRSWDEYPILRFADTPDVVVQIVGDQSDPSLGAGECATAPTAAAIGNAVAHALGVRVRRMPLTKERIVLF
jgi:CO/xanthine dehydrogenase Mo-binding subunit